MTKAKPLHKVSIHNNHKSNIHIKTVTAIGSCYEQCFNTCRKELARNKRDSSTFNVVNVSNEWEWQATEDRWGDIPVIGRAHPFSSRVLPEGEKVLSVTRVRFTTGVTPHLFHVDHHGLPVSRSLITQFKERMPQAGGFFMSASNIYMEQLTAFFGRFANMFPGSPYVLSAAYVPEVTVFSKNIEVARNKPGGNGIAGALIVPKKSSEASGRMLSLDLMKLLSETSDYHSGCLANGKDEWLKALFNGKNDNSKIKLVPGMLPVLNFALYVWPGTYAYWSVGNPALIQLLQLCHQQNRHFVTVPVRTKAIGKVIGTECTVKSITFKRDSSTNQIPVASVALYGIRRVSVNTASTDKNGIYHSLTPYRDTSVGSQEHVNHLLKEATQLMHSLKIIQSPTNDLSNISFTLVGDCVRYGYIHSSVYSTLFHLNSATARLEALCLLLEDRLHDAHQQKHHTSSIRMA